MEVEELSKVLINIYDEEVEFLKVNTSEITKLSEIFINPNI